MTPKSTDTKKLTETLKALWKQEKERFNHPAVGEPKIVEKLEGQNSAAFNWRDHSIQISQEFIDDLTKHMPAEKALQGVVRHETGHWVYFPRELSDKIYLLSEADRIFGPKTEQIYRWYADLADEGELLRWGLAGDEILQMREAFGDIVKSRDKDVPDDFDMNKLLRALYANSFSFEAPKLSKKESQYYEKLKKIPYIGLDLDGHMASLYRFGKAIEDLFKVIYVPACGEGELANVPDKELDGALSAILSKKGARAFKLALAYLKKVRPDFKDPFGDAAKDEQGGKRAGLERGDFKRNDELIPLYTRWAANYGVYIVKRPVETDSSALYRSGKKEFEVGDPVQKIDIFGSRGQIGIPGLSKVHQEEEGAIPSIEWSVPHLLLGVDSSGSMEDPAAIRGAPQVLAAYILGKNYYANGSQVGGWNFSTDIAFIPSSRDLKAYYSLMAGYWGGGTHINVTKLKQFLEESEFGQHSIRFTDEKDYERALKLLPKEKRKEFEEKNIYIDAHKLQGKYAKLDNVLITDGYIANAEEVLRYLQTIGKVTRNFVFLTDKSKYDEWSKIELPNTWVYLAEKPEQLLGLAMGRGRALVTESKSNYEGVKK